MEKIKCNRVYEQDGRYVMGYLVPEGKPNRSAIIVIAGYTAVEAAEKLERAIKEMPEKYARKYETK